MRQLLIMMLVLMPLAGISDQLYRWTDDKGVVHFSSKPLDSDQEHELIPLPDAPTPTPGGLPSEPAEQEKVVEQPPQFAVENAQPTQEDIEYCRQITTNMKTLKNSPRVRIKRENGEYEILGDDARQAEIDRLAKLLKDFC